MSASYWLVRILACDHTKLFYLFVWKVGWSTRILWLRVVSGAPKSGTPGLRRWQKMVMKPVDHDRLWGALCTILIPASRGIYNQKRHHPSQVSTPCDMALQQRDNTTAHLWCGNAQAAHSFSAVQGALFNVHHGTGQPAASDMGLGGSLEVGRSCDTALQCHELLLLVGLWRIHKNWQWGQGDNTKELKWLETWRENDKFFCTFWSWTLFTSGDRWSEELM